MKYTIFFLFMLSLARYSVSAQEMLWGGSVVELKGNIYDFYESEDFFKEVPLAYQNYQFAKSAKKSSVFLKNVSIVSLGVGLLGIFIPNIGGSAMLYVFPTTGALAILFHGNYISQFKKAVGFYNGNRERQNLSREAIGLSFGVTQNGVGLVLNF